ncbi:MAG: carbon-nitrogen hydrolase family protein [Bacillota bacterium]
MRRLKVAAIQAGVDPCWQKEEWLDHLRWQLALCREEGVRLAVFPAWTGCYAESFPDGFPWHAAEDLLRLLGGLAREAGLYLVPGTIPIRQRKKVSLRSFLFSPTGACLGMQDQLCPPAGYEPGTEIEVFTTGWGKMGILIDADAAIPELGRIMALRGVEIVCHPKASFPAGPPGRYGLRQIVRTEQLIGIEAHLVGSFGGRSCRGRSEILVPKTMTEDGGDVLAQAQNTSATEVVLATVDLDKLGQARISSPSYGRFNPYLYRRDLSAAYARLEELSRAAKTEKQEREEAGPHG